MKFTIYHKCFYSDCVHFISYIDRHIILYHEEVVRNHIGSLFRASLWKNKGKIGNNDSELDLFLLKIVYYSLKIYIYEQKKYANKYASKNQVIYIYT